VALAAIPSLVRDGIPLDEHLSWKNKAKHPTMGLDID
jgi:hypothetical protein